MAKSNKTSVSLDDIKRTEDYAEALDKLNSSLKDVNSTLPKFADGLEEGLKGVAEKLPEVIASMTKLNAQNKELAANGQKPVSVLSQLGSSLFSWNNLLSIGVTLLVTYGGALIKWVGDLMKGETKLTALGKALKEKAILTESLLQTQLKASQSAQNEIADLTALYKVSQNQNSSLEKRKEALNALKQQWPDVFSGLKEDTNLAQKAAEAYGKLKDQIIATAYAEAAKNKIAANAERDLENQIKIVNERKNNLALVKNQANLEKEYQRQLSNWKAGGYNDGAEPNLRLSIDLSTQNKLKAASDKIIYDLTTDSKLLKDQNDAYYKEIEKRVDKFGLTVLGYKKAIKTFPPPPNPGQEPETAETPIDHPDKTRHLEAVSISVAETIEARQKNYEKELADLKDQQSKKLITQDEYFKQWAALQQRYHTGIIESGKLFMEKRLEETLKRQREIVEQHRKELVEQGEKDINKAIFPESKLKTELKLIDDKYAYELSLAGTNADKIAQLQQQKQAEITEITKKHEQDRKNFQLETAQQVSDTAFSLLKNNLSSQSNARLKQLQTQKDAELSNTSLTATQRKAIEEKYKKKEAEEKVKAFKAEQRASILQAVINGALAITKVTAQTGVLGAFVIPGIIASTAIQVATIAAQKTPQYAKGGMHYRSDGKGALLPGYSRTDDTNAYLRSGEAVVVSEAMRNPWARNLVSAINVAYGGRDFSVANTSSGYAIGGIYTDGGNSNRYYSQPANDVKDLANTLAYQMINNFPPVFVDVKDINTQQSILAKTVDRVNL